MLSPFYVSDDIDEVRDAIGRLQPLVERAEAIAQGFDDAGDHAAWRRAEAEFARLDARLALLALKESELEEEAGFEVEKERRREFWGAIADQAWNDMVEGA